MYVFFPLEFLFSSSRTCNAWKINAPDVEDAIKNFLEEFQWKSPIYAIKSNYTSPTSLPLNLFCGYQLVQSADLMQKFGHVKNIFKFH